MMAPCESLGQPPMHCCFPSSQAMMDSLEARHANVHAAAALAAVSGSIAGGRPAGPDGIDHGVAALHPPSPFPDTLEGYVAQVRVTITEVAAEPVMFTAWNAPCTGCCTCIPVSHVCRHAIIRCCHRLCTKCNRCAGAASACCWSRWAGPWCGCTRR